MSTLGAAKSLTKPKRRTLLPMVRAVKERARRSSYRRLRTGAKTKIRRG